MHDPAVFLLVSRDAGKMLLWHLARANYKFQRESVDLHCSFRRLCFPSAHCKGRIQNLSNSVQSFFLVHAFGRHRCMFHCDSLCV